MDALTRLNNKALKAAKSLEFKVTYLPGLVEELDSYCASHDKLFTVNCYGKTKEQALNSAIHEASQLLLENPQWIRDLLK